MDAGLENVDEFNYKCCFKEEIGIWQDIEVRFVVYAAGKELSCF